ncbi:MAG: flagellar hook-associated protein FlgK [Agathobacter sp.]|nr:flagellar hook-associated protein FlgK [Agathobacter sp.]
MANGFGSLFVGASGLMSAQNSLNVTANNLANVDTKGYVREQVRYTDQNYITTKNPTKGTNMHQTGLGVSIGDVAHARDIFLDKAYRLETGRSAFYSTYYEVNTQVEDLFQELDGEQFKGAVGDFWQAFQELAKTPEDTTIQNLVLQKAELFLTRSQSLYSDLQSYQTNLNQQVADSVDKVNKLGNRIYELNNIIQKIESGGVETAMTYRDERDNLIDELASYGAVSYQENQFGFMNIDFEGVEFVDEMGCHNMGIYVEDRTTGFYTPYWHRPPMKPQENTPRYSSWTTSP